MTTEQFKDEFKNIIPWLIHGNRKHAIRGKRKVRGRPSKIKAFFFCYSHSCTFTSSSKTALRAHIREVHSY